MGWKNFKEKFQIDHIVQITEKGLCVGSGYVHDLIVINLTTGVATPNHVFPNFIKEHYPTLQSSTPEEILAALNSVDSFSKDIPVYSYENSKIIEDFAEQFGYPNVTHSGQLMYENMHFKTRDAAIKAALQNNKAIIHFTEENIQDYKNRVTKLEQELSELKKYQEELEKQKK